MNENIKKALVYLSEQDPDFARELNGVGFNKFDSRVGRDLALKANSTGLTEKEELLAIKLLQKYRKQLMSAGIEIPEYKLSYRAELVNAATLCIYFDSKPDDEIRFALKNAGARWNPNLPGTPWVLHPDDFGDELKSLLPGIEIVEVKDSVPEPTEPVKQSKKKIIVKDGAIIIRFPYDATLVERVKALPERKYNPKDKEWIVPGTYSKLVIDKFSDFDISLEVKEISNKMEKRAEASRKATSDFAVDGIKGELMPFQKAGVEFLELANGRAIVGDEMGLGKTLQALAYLHLHKELRPAVVVCPASLKLNWKREYQKWVSDNENLFIANGGEPKPVFETGHSILIINYDILTKWMPYLRNHAPKVVVFDEAHYMKNSGSQRSKAGAELAKIANKVLCLTGTPLTNRPIELLPLLKMVAPNDWNEWQYKQRYCGAKHNGWGWDFGGASNLAELHERLKPYMLRRLKKDVLSELPEKRYVPVFITLSSQALREYDLVMSGVKDVIRNVNLSQPREAMNVLAEIERAKQAVAHAKMDAVIEWVDNFLDSGNKLVIFANHSFVIDRLMETYNGIAVKIDGSCSTSDRDKAVEAFQSNPSIKLFVGNIKAAGVGVTLTAASDVAFVEYPWTPGDLTQAIDRCHRIGQRESVTAYFLAVADTIEEKIISLLENKRRVIEQVHDGKASDESLNIFAELVKEMQG